MAFVHLHFHSVYSLTTGLATASQAVQVAAEDSNLALALTDADNLFSTMKFYKAAIEHGVKPIIGCELKVHIGQSSHGIIVVLCQNETGYRNLTAVLTQAYRQRHRMQEFVTVQRDWLGQHNQGLIVLSGGGRGELAQLMGAPNSHDVDQVLAFWKEHFPQRYYLELYRTGRAGEEQYNRWAVDLALRHDLPLVATNDVCFLRAEDFETHEVKVCIASGTLLSSPHRQREHSKEQYLKSEQQMRSLFADLPSAVDNTVEIAKRCSCSLRYDTIQLPRFPLPQDTTDNDYLEQQASHGLSQCLAAATASHPESVYRQRLQRELEIIAHMKYAGYFLIVADFVRWAKQEGIPVGPGRGSGAGSLVAYSLGITEIDPIAYDLLFERFLNPERVSLPDFDIDFCVDSRDRVIEYVADHYGHDQVGQIITFSRLAARGVVRDVARVLGFPYSVGDRIARLIPMRLNITLKEALKKSPELLEAYKQDKEIQAVVDISEKIEGLPRNAGTHAGGVVIAPESLTNYTALYKEPDADGMTTHFDMKDVETVGLVKFDFLGLRTLTVIDKALQIVAQFFGRTMSAADIPLDDQATYELLRQGQTAAVFQLESEGLRQLIRQMRPDKFADLVALVALYRPGPLQSGMTKDYIARKHGADFNYVHHDLAEVLAPTYGVIVYQEQVMEIARRLSGYSLAGADLLRRAMGKKLPEEMEKQRRNFIHGAVERGVKKSIAVEIFGLIEHFAGYGFNKSHSVAYAMLAYRTAWLKANYPAAFMVAELNTSVRDSDKIAALIYECEELGLRVIPVDINRSVAKFTVLSEKEILYGLWGIRNVSQAMTQRVVNERDKNGPFRSLYDLCFRLIPLGVKKNYLENFVRSGCLLSLGQDPVSMFDTLPATCARATQAWEDKNAGQSGLFAGDDEPPPVELAAENISSESDPPPRSQLQALEKEALGFYMRYHPMDVVRAELQEIIDMPLRESHAMLIDQSAKQKALYRLAGSVAELNRQKARDGKRNYFFALDDGKARVEFAYWGQEQRPACLAANQILVVEAQAASERKGERLRWRVRRMMSLDQAREHFARSIYVEVNSQELASDFADSLQETFTTYVDKHKGRPVRVHIHDQTVQFDMVLGEHWKLRPCSDLLAELSQISGIMQASIIYAQKSQRHHC